VRDRELPQKSAYNTLSMKFETIVRPLAVTALLLLVPLVGSRFTDEVQWTMFDYLSAAVLILAVAIAYEWGAKRGGTLAYRLGFGIALGTALLLIWINGAVGIIGDHNPANLMYGAVLVTLTLGAVFARLRPLGMSRALFGTALAQALVPVVALVFWGPATVAWTPSVFGIFALNAVFVVLWLASALLFREPRNPP
jgi:hypothetical protein